MRLEESEIESIKKVLRDLDPSCEIMLYGSRTDDSLKGGDIDLLVFSEVLTFADRITALAELKLRMGDQKIDLLIRTRSVLESDEFVAKIAATSIRLYP